jgi:hypothetical protein
LHYFGSYPVHVVTLFVLREIVENHVTTGRITKWALKLMGLDIAYAPQTAIKSQALADFVAEWTETQQPPSPSLKRILACISLDPLPSMMPGEVTYQSLLKEIDSFMLFDYNYVLPINVVVYDTLVNGLRIAIKLEVQRLYI